MNDHRSARRWRRAIARTTTRFRHVDQRAGDLHLPSSNQLPRGLR